MKSKCTFAGAVLAITLLAGAGQPQTQGAGIPTVREWNRLRARAQTAAEFRRLAAWCQSRVELYESKVAGYEAELKAYYEHPASQPVPKYPQTGQTLKVCIAHDRDLVRHWAALRAEMLERAVKLEMHGAPKKRPYTSFMFP